jgi:hypothetical protein
MSHYLESSNAESLAKLHVSLGVTQMVPEVFHGLNKFVRPWTVERQEVGSWTEMTGPIQGGIQRRAHFDLIDIPGTHTRGGIQTDIELPLTDRIGSEQ